MTGVQHKIVGAGFGAAAAYVMIAGYDNPNGVLVLGASIVGSMLPDIDHDRTKIGRKRAFLTNLATNVANTVIFIAIVAGMIAAALVVKGFVDFGVHPGILLAVSGGGVIIFVLKKVVGDSKIFKWATKHRGLMHTNVVPALLAVALTASEYWLYRYAVMGLLVGYVSHLFADMLTVEGCPVLFPLTRKNIRIGKLVTKDPKCTRVAYVVAILAVIAGYCIVKFLLK